MATRAPGIDLRTAAVAVKCPPRGITLSRQNSIGGGALTGGNASFIGPTTLTSMSLHDRLTARRHSSRRRLSMALNGPLGPGLAIAAAAASGLHLQEHVTPFGIQTTIGVSSPPPTCLGGDNQLSVARDGGKRINERTSTVDECEETVKMMQT